MILTICSFVFGLLFILIVGNAYVVKKRVAANHAEFERISREGPPPSMAFDAFTNNVTQEMFEKAMESLVADPPN